MKTTITWLRPDGTTRVEDFQSDAATADGPALMLFMVPESTPDEAHPFLHQIPQRKIVAIIPFTHVLKIEFSE